MKCYGCGHDHGPKIGARDCNGTMPAGSRCDCVGFIASAEDAPGVLAAFIATLGLQTKEVAPGVLAVYHDNDRVAVIDVKNGLPKARA